MLRLIIPASESFNEDSGQFVDSGDAFAVELEHSLASVSKWESVYEKPFLTTSEKTPKEIFDYIRFTIIGPEPPPEVFARISENNLEAFNKYLSADRSATTIKEIKKAKKSREIITSELIYYWMISLGIPFECQDWHLNRLLTLIRVCNIKNAPKEKMTRAEMAQQAQFQQNENARRRAELGSKG